MFFGMVMLTPSLPVKESPIDTPDSTSSMSIRQPAVASAGMYGALATTDREGDEAGERVATGSADVEVLTVEAKQLSPKTIFRMSKHTVGHNGTEWFLNEAPLSRNIFTLELMLMWVVSFGVWGTTTLITGNSSQIYQSLDYDGYKETTNAVYVSIFGVASALGRVAVGALQPMLLARRRHVVTLFPIAPLINTVALPLFFLVPSGALIVPFFLCGLATGCTWGSTVLIIKSLFHHSSCGKHYNVLYTAGMLTPIVMNIALFGPVYDSHSRAQGLDALHSCRGSACVLAPMMVSLGLNVVAFCAAYVFFLRVSTRGGIASSSS
jgi:hypothetical protein